MIMINFFFGGVFILFYFLFFILLGFWFIGSASTPLLIKCSHYFLKYINSNGMDILFYFKIVSQTLKDKIKGK